MSRFGQAPVAPAPAPIQTASFNQAQYAHTIQEITGSKTYTRKVLPQVGQPYALQMSDADVTKAVYGAPLEFKSAIPPIAGAEPQKVITLPTGLDVPVELLERDLERKKLAAKETELLISTKPTKLFEIGHFANSKPLHACIIALAIGAALGTFFYNSQHPPA